MTKTTTNINLYMFTSRSNRRLPTLIMAPDQAKACTIFFTKHAIDPKDIDLEFLWKEEEFEGHADDWMEAVFYRGISYEFN